MKYGDSLESSCSLGRTTGAFTSLAFVVVRAYKYLFVKFWDELLVGATVFENQGTELMGDQGRKFKLIKTTNTGKNWWIESHN